VLDELNAVEHIENYISDHAVCCIILILDWKYLTLKLIINGFPPL
jgi:hypothetical protein